MASIWSPQIEESERELRIYERVKKRPLFAFFRRYRHVLFDEATQSILIDAYGEVARGKPAIEPARMAMAMLMQAAFGVPDHEVPELTACDVRWQMVLDCVGAEEPIFSQGSIFNFRMRCIEHGLVQKLIDRTVMIAKQTKGFSAAHLRAALDSSPLWGAGRVEDTFNLIGRAAALVVRSAASRTGMSVAQVAETAGIPVVTASSIKAALDLDWSDPSARTTALRTLLGQVSKLREWLADELAEACQEPPLKQQLEVLVRLIDQDTEPDPDGGGPRIKKGTTPDRQISVHDPDMRHGRKSRSKRFDGYKRHIVTDLDIAGLVRAATVTPANVPEAEAAEPLIKLAEQQGDRLSELHVDRAYVNSDVVTKRTDLHLVAKPHPLPSQGRLTKEAFELNFDAMTIQCPNGVTVPMRLGQHAQFPAATCRACPLQDRCTSSKTTGRQVSIQLHEQLQAELRASQRTRDGRAALRERVAVEHGLARLGQTQGTRARYRGLSKNVFDVQRHAVVSNCYVLDQLLRAA